MTKEAMKSFLSRGGKAVSAWLVIPSPMIAELVAREDFDCITLDLQHSEISTHAAIEMMRAMAAPAMPAIVRVPWNEPASIMRMLDAGAVGIICPMVNTAEQCRAFVEACRYKPAGYRSWGPQRATLAANGDYHAFAEAQVLTFAMIETMEAVDNLDEILSVPGLDGIFVGPSDLSATIGFSPAPDWEDGPVLDTIRTILSKTLERKLIPGISTNSATYARRMLDAGFRFVTVPAEVSLMLDGIRQTLDIVKAEASS